MKKDAGPVACGNVRTEKTTIGEYYAREADTKAEHLKR